MPLAFGGGLTLSSTGDMLDDDDLSINSLDGVVHFMVPEELLAFSKPLNNRLIAVFGLLRYL